MTYAVVWLGVDLLQVMFMGNTLIFSDSLSMADFLQKQTISFSATTLTVASSR